MNSTTFLKTATLLALLVPGLGHLTPGRGGENLEFLNSSYSPTRERHQEYNWAAPVNSATLYASTIPLLVRMAPLKGIRGWDDLANTGISGMKPIPKSPGRSHGINPCSTPSPGFSPLLSPAGLGRCSPCLGERNFAPLSRAWRM